MFSFVIAIFWYYFLFNIFPGCCRFPLLPFTSGSTFLRTEPFRQPFPYGQKPFSGRNLSVAIHFRQLFLYGTDFNF